MTAAEAARILREWPGAVEDGDAEAACMGAAALEREAAAEAVEPMAMCCNSLTVRYEAEVAAAYPPAVLAARLRATARALEAGR